jgi:hypothetical protein
MEKIVNILYVSIFIYVIFTQIMALYFLYLWAQTHSFINTIIIGTIVSEIKGILFPFFI